VGSDEQTALTSFVSGSVRAFVRPESLELLELKGLIVSRPDAASAIFSPLFEKFIEHQRIAFQRGIKLDKARAMVWIDGRTIHDLTRLELELLGYLLEKRGQVCSRDELIAYLYPDEEIADSGVSDNRIDTIVGRLREKIEPERNKPRYILTVRGYGYKLAE
jgi:DNA-binding response OmpR family regulator